MISNKFKYPIGIQTFEKIREGGYIYADKTGYVYRLAQQFQFVFLSRPRRFGKSLLLSTMKSYFEGRRDLFEGLEAGRYDIMINGVDVTPEREQKYDFSTPYAYNRTAVIVRGDDDSIQTMEDLNGKSTANTISSTYAEVAEKYGATVTGVDDLNQTMELLISGRIDATLNAEVTFYDYLKAHPDANVKIACLDPEETSVAIPMRKGEETATLLAAVNDALAQLRADGTLTALSEKYFGTDISGSDR